MSDLDLAELRRTAESARLDPYAVVATGDEMLGLIDRIETLTAALARVTDYETMHAALSEAYANDEIAGIVVTNRFVTDGDTDAAPLPSRRLEAALARVTDDGMAERLADALVMTGLSDHAGTDMRLINEAAGKVLAVIRAIAAPAEETSPM
jgi:hypothetical protein